MLKKHCFTLIHGSGMVPGSTKTKTDNKMKMQAYSGYYGSGKTPCTVLVGHKATGENWYCVEGSVNVNCTYQDITNGVDVEDLEDFDMFTASAPIEDLDQLEEEILG